MKNNIDEIDLDKEIDIEKLREASKYWKNLAIEMSDILCGHLSSIPESEIKNKLDIESIKKLISKNL